jgi:hypothetical protein
MPDEKKKDDNHKIGTKIYQTVVVAVTKTAHHSLVIKPYKLKYAKIIYDIIILQYFKIRCAKD